MKLIYFFLPFTLLDPRRWNINHWRIMFPIMLSSFINYLENFLYESILNDAEHLYEPFKMMLW